MPPTIYQPLPRVSASILVVEDEALLGIVLEELLCEQGHCVRLALTGGDGLAILESGFPVNALVTDIRLPEVDGWAIARRAREMFPALPVIYMSGDSASEHASKGVANSIMVAKPFSMEAFANSVSALIH